MKSVLNLNLISLFLKRLFIMSMDVVLKYYSAEKSDLS